MRRWLNMTLAVACGWATRPAAAGAEIPPPDAAPLQWILVDDWRPEALADLTTALGAPPTGGADLSFAGGNVRYRLTPTFGGTIVTGLAADDAIDPVLRFDVEELLRDGSGAWHQDVALFHFGGPGAAPRPFLPHRVGAMTAGVTLAGELDGLRVGLLDAVVEDGAGTRNLTVARAAMDLDGLGTIGAIATHGDPAADGANTVYGADLSVRRDHVIGDQPLAGSAWFMRSHSSEASGGRNAWGAALSSTTDRLSLEAGITVVDEAFRAALGSVPSRGTRELTGAVRYRWRPEGLIRLIDTGVSGRFLSALGTDADTGRLDVNVLTLETAGRERLAFTYGLRRDVLTAPHSVGGGVTVPVGAYVTSRYGVAFSTSSARPIRGRVAVESGEYYTGARTETSVGVQWRPAGPLAVDLEYARQDVDLPATRFSSGVARVRCNVAVAPGCSWANLVEYTETSEDVRIDSRVRWVLEPGSELSVGVSRRLDVGGAPVDDDRLDLGTNVALSVSF